MSSSETCIANWNRSHAWSMPLNHPPVGFALITAIIAILLLLTQSLLLTNRIPTLHLTFDNRETAALVNGFHAVEYDESRSATGAGSYRWTSGDSQITIHQVGAPVGVRGSTPLRLTLSLGPSLPQQAISELTIGYTASRTSRLAVDIRPRHYHLMVPADALQAGNLTITLQSETATVPPDTRPVGVRVEAVSLTFLDTQYLWIGVAPAGLQVALLVLTALLLRRLAVPLLVSSGGVLLVAIALLITHQSHTLLFYPYLVRLTIAWALLACLTFGLLPLTERHAGWLASPRLMRVLWGIMLLACALRLAGSLYPLFSPYDISHNVERLIKAISGTLVVTSRSIEFRNGITVYPPGPYIALLPGQLLNISPTLLIQGGIAIIDGIGALTIALLARALGAGNRTTIFSALLYAAIPINLTALWWGHTAQIFGQALMPPLAIVLLLLFRQPAPYRVAILAGVILSVALLSHIGVTIVAVAWLGLLGVLLRLRRTVPVLVTETAWWRFAAVVLLSCVASVVLIYSAVAILKLQQAFEIGEKVLTSDYVPAYGLIWRGFRIAFHRVGFVMLIPGIVLLCMRHLPRGGLELVLSWLGVVLVFWAIEMVSALQVRYIYFLTPLACIAIGLLIDKLIPHRGIMRYAAWIIVLLLLAQGSTYWYTGTFEGSTMSVSPLVR